MKIPFAHVLAEMFPAEKVEARRAYKQVLATIETIVFLHQFHREPIRDRYIATLDDYRLARQILMGPLNESLGPGDAAWRAYNALKSKFPKGSFTSQDALRAKVFNNRVTANNRLKELEKIGAIVCVEKGKGPKPARWAWTKKTLGPVLPEAEALEASIA